MCRVGGYELAPEGGWDGSEATFEVDYKESNVVIVKLWNSTRRLGAACGFFPFISHPYASSVRPHDPTHSEPPPPVRLHFHVASHCTADTVCPTENCYGLVQRLSRPIPPCPMPALCSLVTSVPHNPVPSPPVPIHPVPPPPQRRQGSGEGGEAQSNMHFGR